MCGIVGLITKATNGFAIKEIEVITQMLHSNQVRGSDGTGVFYNTKANKGMVKVVKSAVPACDFIRTTEYNNATDTFLRASNFVIGHNRSATKGKIDNDCTHPFKEKHITLIHNGTLETQKELNDTVEVDSHAICHSMAEIGAEETIKLLNGAFALVWWNAIDKTLNICRNNSRPLFIIETKDNHILTSELELGEWMCARHHYTIVSKKAVEIKKIYTFHIKDMKTYTTKDIEFKKLEWLPLTTAAWKETDNYHNYANGNWHKQKSFFYFGEKIRFKGCMEMHKTAETNLWMMTGDILKFQDLDPAYAVLVSDFEKKWRVRVVGTKEHLETLLKQDKLTGTVAKTYIKGSLTTFIVENVIPTPIIDLKPKVIGNYTERTGELCEWCKGPIKQASNLFNFTICEICASEQDGPTYCC